MAPHVPRRRKTVTHVQRLRRGDHAMAKATLVGQDDVISAEIKALKSQRIQGKKELVMAFDPRQPVHPRGADVPLSISGRHSPCPIYTRIDRRLGKQRDQVLQHLLGAPHLV